MLETVLGATLPVVASVLLGFVAGWRHDENPSTANPINTMVLRYALPLSLFAATVATPRAQLLAQGPLARILIIALVVPVAFAFVQYMISRNMTASALQALAFGQINFAIKYKTDEQENASVLLCSNLLAVFSVAGMVLLVK